MAGMEPTDDLEEHDDTPTYRTPEEIDATELTSALNALHLLADDMFLRTQATHLAVVDHFITELEYQLLRKQFHEEPISSTESLFLAAQSQMWIFAAYELLRTWRERAKHVLKLHRNGGLELKIKALEQELGFQHWGRKSRADQLKMVLNDPSIIAKIEDDIRITHIPFVQLEALRVALAKHEVGGNKKSVANAPGFGRVNRWCGSVDYEHECNGAILGYISRRNIAESLRALSDRSHPPPSDKDLAEFDEFMKGPPSSDSLGFV
jgi:hypothetical protein